MKITTALLLSSTVYLVGCANPGVVKVAPDTYMLAREDHGGIFGNPSAMKEEVYRDANIFAEKQNKVAIPISATSHPVGVLGDWATFEWIFKIVNKEDPLAKESQALIEAGKTGDQGWRSLGGKATNYTAKPLNVNENKSSVGSSGINKDKEINKLKNENLTYDEYMKRLREINSQP